MKRIILSIFFVLAIISCGGGSSEGSKDSGSPRKRLLGTNLSGTASFKDAVTRRKNNIIISPVTYNGEMVSAKPEHICLIAGYLLVTEYQTTSNSGFTAYNIKGSNLGEAGLTFTLGGSSDEPVYESVSCELPMFDS